MTREQIKDYSIKVTQASATRLVQLTLEITASYLKDAQDNQDDVSVFRYNIKKSRTFIAHLISSLNMEYPISRELFNIYSYLNTELQKADIRADAVLLPRLRGIIDTLSEAFAEICEEDRGGMVMENTQKVYAGLTYSKGSLNESIYDDNSRGFTV